MHFPPFFHPLYLSEDNNGISQKPRSQEIVTNSSSLENEGPPSGQSRTVVMGQFLFYRKNNNYNMEYHENYKIPMYNNAKSLMTVFSLISTTDPMLFLKL